jgi:hypothetical protein
MQQALESSGFILKFGSRSHAYSVLAFCALVVALLGWFAARELRRRYPRIHPWQLAIPGLLICLAPEALIYASSRNGFYEVEQSGDQIRFHYLLPGRIDAISFSDISKMEAEPDADGKGGWRLLIVGPSGERYESASGPQEDATNALEQLVMRWRGGER